VNKNVIILKRAGADKAWAHATIITGSIAMIPSHFFHEGHRIITNNPEDEDSILEMYTTNGVKFKETTMLDFLNSDKHVVEQTDLALFVIPGKLKTFPNIVKHFILNDDLPNKYVDINLICANESGGYINHETEAIMTTSDLHYVNTAGDKFLVNRSFSYRADTIPGDCGNIIFATHLNFFPAPILGMHIAGTTSDEPLGFSNVLTRESILDTISKFDPIETNSPPISEFKYIKEPRYDFVHKEFRIASSTSLPLGMATQSALRKTKPIFGIFGDCPFTPAIMAPYYVGEERIDPLTTATLKYQQTAPHIPRELLEAVTDDLISDILESSTPFKYRKLTFEQAVEGIPGAKFIDGLARKTSAGYPYCKLKPSGGKGKQTLFGKIGSYEFDSKDAVQVKQDVEAIIDAARNKKRMIHIYGDFLKDELRPTAKATKPRLVSCAPVEFTIAYRKLFLPIHAWFMENRVNNGFAVGINPYNEWGRIIVHMQMDDSSKSYIAGDFSGFDTRISSVFQDYVAKVYKAILRKEIEEDPPLANCVDILLMDIFSSVHIAKENIYYWTSGQPSGNPATTFINCIVNRLLIRMCWVSVNDRNLDSIVNFRGFVKDVVFGDDNIISVHEDARKVFNPTSIATAMLEFNMIYTSEDKGEFINEFRNYWEVGFLKRGFKWDEENEMFFAPLDITTVTYMMYYHRRSKNFKENIQLTFESFLDELSLHDDSVYEEYFGKIAPIMLKEFEYQTKVSDHQERKMKTLGKKLVY
jgi:hypothetical protein